MRSCAITVLSPSDSNATAVTINRFIFLLFFSYWGYYRAENTYDSWLSGDSWLSCQVLPFLESGDRSLLKLPPVETGVTFRLREADVEVMDTRDVLHGRFECAVFLHIACGIDGQLTDDGTFNTVET